MMTSRKEFIRRLSVLGVGLMFLPGAAAATSSSIMQPDEAEQLAEIFQQMAQLNPRGATPFKGGLRPVRLISRKANNKGYTTTFRTANGGRVVLENQGKGPVTRFYGA